MIARYTPSTAASFVFVAANERIDKFCEVYYSTRGITNALYVRIRFEYLLCITRIEAHSEAACHAARRTLTSRPTLLTLLLQRSSMPIVNILSSPSQ